MRIPLRLSIVSGVMLFTVTSQAQTVGDIFSTAFKTFQGVNIWGAAPIQVKNSSVSQSDPNNWTLGFSLKFDVFNFGSINRDIDHYSIIKYKVLKDTCGCSTTIDTFLVDKIDTNHLKCPRWSFADADNVIKNGELQSHNRITLLRHETKDDPCNECERVLVDSVESFQKSNSIRLHFGYDYTDSVSFAQNSFHTWFPLGAIHLEATFKFDDLICKDWPLTCGFGGEFYKIENAYATFKYDTIGKSFPLIAKVTSATTFCPEIFAGVAYRPLEYLAVFAEANYQWISFRGLTYEVDAPDHSFQDYYAALPTSIKLDRLRLTVGVSLSAQ